LLADDLVVTGSDDRDPGGVGFIYAFERSGGRLRWKRAADRGVMGGLLRRGPRVYGVSLADELLCLDLATGRVLWSHPGAKIAPDALAGFQSTPALADDMVYVGGQDGSVYGLAAESGKVHWKRDLGSPIVTAIAQEGPSLYLATRAQRLIRLDRGDGRILAEIVLGARIVGTVVPAADGLFLFALDRRNGDEPALSLHRYPASLATSQPTWIRELPGGWTSSRPYIFAERLVGGGEKGDLIGLSLTDGGVVWSDRVEGVVRGIGQQGRRLFVGTLSGTIYAYEPPL
jgi:eukaryotic-like serine/threonine-protein kinase